MVGDRVSGGNVPVQQGQLAIEGKGLPHFLAGFLALQLLHRLFADGGGLVGQGDLGGPELSGALTGLAQDLDVFMDDKLDHAIKRYLRHLVTLTNVPVVYGPIHKAGLVNQNRQLVETL